MRAIIRKDIVKYPDVVTAKNGKDVLENGAFVALGGLVDSLRGRDSHKIEKLAVDTADWGYVCDVSMPYDEIKDERDFSVAANLLTRVYRPKKGDAITIAVKHVEGSVDVGAKLQLKAESYKLEAKTEGIAVAEVLEKCNFEGQESLYIRFI